MASGAYAVRRHVENVYLVREPDRTRRRELFAIPLVVVPLLSVLVICAWANVSSFTLGYRIEALEKHRQELLETRRKLRLDRAAARAVARIEPLARAAGLAPARPDQVIEVLDASLAREATAVEPPASKPVARYPVAGEPAEGTPPAGPREPTRGGTTGAETSGPAAPSSPEGGL